jgi:hypothetical protein
MRSLKIVMLLSILTFCGILAAQNSPKPVSPVIVAKQSFLVQNSNIPITTLYTPSVDGDYEVFYYGNAQAPDNTCNSSFQTPLTWTDDYRLEQINLQVGPSGTGTLITNTSVVMHVKAGSPIQISGTYSPGTCSASYNFFLTVIKD